MVVVVVVAAVLVDVTANAWGWSSEALELHVDRRTSSSIVWRWSLWCPSAKSAGHRSHKCSADSTSSPHNRQTASSEIPTKCCQRRRAGWWRSKWKFPLRGRITHRHCRQPKLPSFLYSSNRLLVAERPMPAMLHRLSASVCRRYRSWPHWQWNHYGLHQPKPRNTTSWRLMRRANNNNRVMTTVEASQVGAFSLGKGRFDLLFRERRVHLLQSLLLDGRGATGTADDNSLCVGLSLCRTQFSLVVS